MIAIAKKAVIPVVCTKNIITYITENINHSKNIKNFYHNVLGLSKINLITVNTSSKANKIAT